MSSINAGTIDSATKRLAKGDPEAMRVLLNAIAAQLNIPGQPALLEPTSGATKAAPVNAPPAAASLAVTGANGLYNISISNPAQTVPATIYHEVSYSTTSNFASPVSLPITSATSIPVSIPGTTLYWRIRSSFDQVHFNAYTPSQGGNPGVSAGLQSSAATSNATVLNQTNYATIDSEDNGAGSANIRIYGPAGPLNMYPAVKGGTETILPSATIINVPFSTNKVVAYDGEMYRVHSTLPQAFTDELTPTGAVSVVGSGAFRLPTIVPIEVSGAIVGYNVTDGGNGLTGPVTIVLVGTGTGATAGAQIITGGVLRSVGAGNVGTGYGSGTTATVSGGTSSAGTGGGQALGGQNGRVIFNDTTTGAAI